ncbi:hypothetical protein CEP88_12015 [Roseobacter denitrificans]|uniref:Uncharacterized protein n=1 Tax=Roseobacter denitrificans (strain ATCC 33942 / OCh 114) TaxID=375451 RepID=Q16D79_ROSDO|nr:hypothetical protein [Roseobacter denitrificans]ABG30064.1 hypothetical protein RD1_0341 [Roseobacter denitrificans OCh 114]AVL53261.1 hypothetical protein CEP88_12015 [Roseobacter denitrificans]SFF69201.1 hypothetical protein SAMN05443635_10171 [Roseobacter denitrificans OCh 114]
MPEVIISIPMSDEEAQKTVGKQIMVLFVSDDQRAAISATMGQTHEFLSLTHQNLNTLGEIAETRGAGETDLTKTIGQLRDPSRKVLGAFEGLMKFLGQAHFIKPGSNGERLQ